MFAYVAGALLAGVGGVIIASQLKSGSPTFGQMYELYVIAAVVVGGASLNGGKGQMFGTLIGTLIMAHADDDGLGDGLEAGVVTAHADTRVAAGRFTPDLDPATTTDPTVGDTDGGGALEKAERRQGLKIGRILVEIKIVDRLWHGQPSALSTPVLTGRRAAFNRDDRATLGGRYHPTLPNV
jgi:hypothetical protein